MIMPGFGACGKEGYQGVYFWRLAGGGLRIWGKMNLGVTVGIRR